MRKFELGLIQATPGALEALGGWPPVLRLIARHARGDWGDLDEEDKAANEAALRHGGRLFSAYTVRDVRVWVITEAVGDDGHRASTTVLLPEEY